MTGLAWREDDFEEHRFNPCFLPSGGTNTSIIEIEHCLAFGQAGPDIIYVGPDGRIISVEAKPYSSLSQTAVVLLHLSNRQWFHSKNLVRFQPHVDTGVVLSRASVDEPCLQVEPDKGVSRLYANVTEDDEYSNIATHPLARSAYEQLKAVPDSYKEQILLVLHQFVISLPKRETTSLPSLRLTALDDSSYLLEWTFKDRRLGFSFEADPKESGWYYVYSSNSSERYESGTMDQLEMTRLIEITLKS